MTRVAGQPMGASAGRALLAEGDRLLAVALSAHLRRDGFQVVEAASGLEALSVLRRGTVDIALVDPELAETVDVHVAALRRKLGSSISIATLRGLGYMLEPVPVG
jgi:DNA-binding response OmpR family regulator